MARREEYVEKTEALLTPVTDGLGFELVDVEYVKEGSDFYLRAYIDKPGGITIDDCETVSRKLSDLLDEHDFIEDAYILEVSSPGLGRQLKKEKDYKRSIGQSVDIKLYKAMDGAKEYTGILTAYDDTSFTIESEGKLTVIQRDNTAKISLTLIL